MVASPDGALGLVDDAPQRHVVRWVYDDAQISYDVAHFLAVVKTHASVNPVGNARAHQHFFQHAGLRVHAVQHGHRVVGYVRLVHLLHPVADPGGFLPLIACVEQADLFAFVLLRPQRLFLAAGVMRDDVVRRIQNVGGRAVVLLEFNDLGSP